jgi:ligand-binding sensor domain-containing protein
MYRMKLCRTSLIFLFGLCIAYHSYSAQPRISKAIISSQLQQPTVSSIFRDSKGVLWIGTQQGLHRFDGANHNIFNSNRSNKNWIPNSYIQDIAEDSDGNLLVAPSSGELLKYNRKEESLHAISQDNIFYGTKLRGLLTSNQGSAWILSDDGLFPWKSRFEQIPGWLRNSDLLNRIGTPTTISEDDSGNILVGGYLGIAIFFLQEETIVSYDLKTLGVPKNAKITALESGSDNTLFFGTSTGNVATVDIFSGNILSQASVAELGPTFISSLLLHQYDLIIATDRGLYSANENLSSIEDLGNQGAELSNTDIYSLYEDGKHIWIGTGDGLDILSFASFDLLNQRNSDVYNDIFAFEEDAQGRIWIGTYTGLYRYDDVTQSHIKVDLRLKNFGFDDQRITTIFSRRNQLWVGSLGGGVKIFNMESGESRSFALNNTNDLAITKILGT